MLAYLDDILEPDDHAEIGQKIKESEFATDLVRRTRDVMLRLRLGAPQVVGKGMGLDANTVAEYLDNTMPPERVADFEKVCLESDVHLAESAACHQILTLVLGQPAAVPPALRDRMYGIPGLNDRLEKDEADEAAAKSGILSALATASVSPPPTPDEPKRHKPEVPDYLRHSRRSRRKMWVLAAIAAALVGVIVTAVVKPEAFGPLLVDPGPGEGERVLAEQGVDPAKFTAPPTVDMGQPMLPGEPGGGTLLPDGTTPAPPFEGPREPATNGGVAPPHEPTIPIEPQPGPGEAIAKGPGLTDPREPTPGVGDPIPLPLPVPGEPMPVEPVPGEPTPAGPVVGGPTVPPEGEGPMTVDGPADTRPVGAYVSDMDVLLRLDPDSETWQRLAPRASLQAGDVLLALPTFRPTIALGSGFTMQLAGGTAVELTPPDAEGVIGVDVRYGQIIAVETGQPGARLRFTLGGEDYVAAFNDAHTTLAVQLQRLQVPGADPEAAPAPVQVDLYTASGRVLWDVGPDAVETVAPAHWRIPQPTVIDEAAQVELPKWIDSEPLSATDRRASIALEEALAVDKPLSLVLNELVAGRRIEVRSLAARCSVYVGQFEPFVAALNDSDQRAAWGLHIEALRNALSLSPQVAGRVRAAFLAKRGDDGESLYRMLWGYSPQDLKSGADKQLVKYLDHSQLDYRVLAFWNVRTITGLGMNYRPEYNQERREQSVRRWQERLAAGEVRYSAQPVAPGPPAEGAEAPAAEPKGPEAGPDLLEGLRELQE
jgi:hypothetical protein